VPITVITGLILIVGSVIFPARDLSPWAEIKPGFWRWLVIFSGVFILSLDFYNWQRHYPVIGGLPFWLWFHILLNALLFFAILSLILRQRGKEGQRQSQRVI